MPVAIDCQTIVIGVLARDCKESLLNNMRRVEEIGEAFQDYHIVVYENDSKDGTTDILQEWAARNTHVVAICETTNLKTIPSKSKYIPFPLSSIHRIERMAHFRNRVLDEVRNRFSPDIFCFVDIDIERFSSQSVISAIREAPLDWGGLFASGLIAYTNKDGSEYLPPLQYDTYAYVPYGIDPIMTSYWLINPDYTKVTARLFGHSLNRQRYLPCYSAFNGLGIYRWEAIKDLSYRALQTEDLKPFNMSLCEHVPINMDISHSGYGLYVVRDMEVIYMHKRNTLMSRINRWKHDWQARRLIRKGIPYS